MSFIRDSIFPFLILLAVTLSSGCSGESETDRLVKQLGDEETYPAASKALKEMGADAVPALIIGLRSDDAKIRQESARTLGFIGPDAKDAVPALIKALKDEVMVVRADAAWALGNVGSMASDAVPALIKALDDSEDTVRSFAIDALGNIGPEASQALPLLRYIAENDENPFIRESATEAVNRIEGKEDENTPEEEAEGA